MVCHALGNIFFMKSQVTYSSVHIGKISRSLPWNFKQFVTGSIEINYFKPEMEGENLFTDAEQTYHKLQMSPLT